MSLPFAFGTTVATVPQDVPYLRPAPQRVQRWREALRSPRPNIGLTWTGNPRFATDYRRSLSLAQLLPFLPEGADYWCLPKDLPERESALLQQTDRIRRFGDRPFSDTAAQMLGMDLSRHHRHLDRQPGRRARLSGRRAAGIQFGPPLAHHAGAHALVPDAGAAAAGQPRRLGRAAGAGARPHRRGRGRRTPLIRTAPSRRTPAPSC
jgi:hypothetical protein